MKTTTKRLSLVPLLLLATIAQAAPLQITPESATLYFKALPYLEKLDEVENETLNARLQLPEHSALPDQLKQQYRDKVQALLKDGLPPLKRSADAGNPAAQYRLAVLVSQFDPRDQTANRVCTLLKSSLSQGFAAAGLEMISHCLDEVATPDFRTLVDALPDDRTPYNQYYPLSTMAQTCDSTHGISSVRLDEKGFRANLYAGLATVMLQQGLKQEQLHYLGKAAEAGCSHARERLALKTRLATEKTQ